MNITTSQIATTAIPASETWFQTTGHTTPTDGGHVVFTQAIADPNHALCIQSADGRWWDLPPQTMNIRMFGAHPSRTKAQNKAAIQNALAYAAYKGSKVNITRGVFPIDPIDFGVGLFLDGDGKGSALKGNYAGFLLKRVGGAAGNNGPTKFSNFQLINEHNEGCGLDINNGILFTVEGILFNCRKNAIRTGAGPMDGTPPDNDAYVTTIRENIILGYGGLPGSMGIIAGGHTRIVSNNITYFDVAARLFHIQNKFADNRVEVNDFGVQTGYNEEGQDWPTHATIEDNYFEANGVHILGDNMSGRIVGNRGHGGNNGPAGQTAIGMYLGEIDGTTVQSNFMGNGHSQAAIKAFAKWKNSVVQANKVQNTIPTGKRWDIDGFAHENCLLEPNAA